MTTKYSLAVTDVGNLFNGYTLMISSPVQEFLARTFTVQIIANTARLMWVAKISSSKLVPVVPECDKVILKGRNKTKQLH